MCSICRRSINDEDYVEKHHLIPVVKKGKNKETIKVCIDCGDQLHKLFSVNELKDELSSLDAILNNERVKKWIKWIKKQKKFGVCMKSKKRRK